MNTAEQRRINGKKYRQRWYTGVQTARVTQEERPEIPARVLRERDKRRDLAPSNLTAALMGDPLPGRSALDRQ